MQDNQAALSSPVCVCVWKNGGGGGGGGGARYVRKNKRDNPRAQQWIGFHLDQSYSLFYAVDYTIF